MTDPTPLHRAAREQRNRRPASDSPPARWRVERRKGWTTVANQTSGVAFSTKDHARAIAWIRADREDREETR